MKRFLLIPLACLFLTLPAFNQTVDERGYIVKVGQTVPDFKIKFQDGKVMDIKDLRGKVVMLQFTASWCGVCRKEMPFIESDIWNVYKDRGLKLFGIDRGEPLEKVKEFTSQMKITYPLVLDEDSGIFTLFADKAAGVTRNILVDRDGKMVYLTRLYDEVEFEGLKKKIAELMK